MKSLDTMRLGSKMVKGRLTLLQNSVSNELMEILLPVKGH